MTGTEWRVQLCSAASSRCSGSLLGASLFEKGRDAEARGPRFEVRAIDLVAADSQDRYDVAPLLVGDFSTRAVPKKFAQDRVFGCFDDQSFATRADLARK